MAMATGELETTPFSRFPALPGRRLLGLIGVLAVLVGFAAASYLAYTGNAATSNYSVQRMRAERDIWQMRNEQLRLELTRLRSLSWVEREAVTRLGMQKPGQLTYLRMESTLKQASSEQALPATSP